MADYRYLFADLLTDEVIAELPLTDVTYSCELNGVGSLKGKLLLGDQRTDHAEPSSAVTAAARTNLCPNPSFEVDTAGWQTTNGNCSITRSTAWAFAGSASMLITQNNSSTGVAQTTTPAGSPAVTAGLTYTFSTYALRGVGVMTGQLIVRWKNAAGSDISAAASAITTISNIPTSPTRVSFTATAPALAAYGTIQWENTGTRATNDTVYVDAFLVERAVAPAGAYFDGGFAPLGTQVSSLTWSGTPNASSSVLIAYTGAVTGPTTIPANLWPLESLLPARTAVYVDRDRTLQWGGILWGRPYKSKDGFIEFNCLELESYWNRRRIITTYTANNTDQMTVAAALVNQIQAVPSGSLGIIVPSVASGVLVSKVYNGYEQKPLLEALIELSRSATGFDFAVDVTYDEDYNIVKTLDLAYPRRGTVYSPTSSTATMLAFPGNVIEYDYPEDGGGVANTMYGNGAGNGAGRVTSVQSNAGKLAEGWPVLEGAVSLSDYSNPALIEQLTLAELDSALEPVVVIQVTISTLTDPQIGSYKTGDDVRLRITDARFPDTLDVIRRISKYEVTPGENGPELVKLTLVETVTT